MRHQNPIWIGLAIATAACGGGGDGKNENLPGPGHTAALGTAPESYCDELTVGDPCVDEATLKGCENTAAQCEERGGLMYTLESCPLQFECRLAFPYDVLSHVDDDICESLVAGVSCVDEDTITQCFDVRARCKAGHLGMYETCPIEFACHEEPPRGPGPGPEPQPGSYCETLSLEDGCVNEENLADCFETEAQCDGHIAVLERCPLQFGCGGGQPEPQPGSYCDELTIGECATQETIDECRRVEKECGGSIGSVGQSCPPVFGC